MVDDSLGSTDSKDLILLAVSVVSSAVNIVEIWDKDLYETSINGED
jgi:MraZ protein